MSRLLMIVLHASLCWGCLSPQPLGIPASGTYRTSHGEWVASPFAPYLEDYARANGIDTNALLNVFISHPVPPGTEAFFIASEAYITADWTYFVSANTRVYELLKLGPCLLALSSTDPPSVSGRWSLTLLSKDNKTLSKVDFRTQPKPNSEVNSITTSISAVTNELRLSITYAHAGRGEPRDQQFRVIVPFRTRIGKPRVIRLK